MTRSSKPEKKSIDPHTIMEAVRKRNGGQRTQSSAATFALWYGIEPQRIRTRMTRIARIFTDPCASASTVAPVDVALTYGSRHTWRFMFNRNSSAFICVHLRLKIVSLNDRIQQIQLKLFPIIKVLYCAERDFMEKDVRKDMKMRDIINTDIINAGETVLVVRNLFHHGGVQ